MEKDHQDLMKILTSESTFKIFNISKELPTVVKSLAVTFSVASLLSMYSDKEFTYFLQCVNSETILNTQVMSKLQALRNVGVAGHNGVGILRNTAKCVLRTKQFMVDKLNMFLKAKHTYDDIQGLHKVIQETLAGSTPV